MESHTGKGTCAGRWEGTGPWVACCGPSRPAHEKIKAFGTTTIIEVTFGARSPIIWEFGRRRAIPPRRRRGKRFKRSQDLASLGGSAREHPNRSHPSPTPRLEAQRPARLRALRADGPPPPPPSASGPPQFDLQRESLSGQPTPRSHTPHREPCTTVDKGDRSCAVPWGGGGGGKVAHPSSQSLRAPCPALAEPRQALLQRGLPARDSALDQQGHQRRKPGGERGARAAPQTKGIRTKPETTPKARVGLCQGVAPHDHGTPEAA